VQMSAEESLPALDAIMSTMLGWVTINAAINPMRPEVYVRALRATLADFVPDETQREAMLTPAASAMGFELRRTYREFSDWLRSTGIEPAASSVAHMVAQGPLEEAKTTITKSLLTLDKLRKLLSGELDGTPATGKDFLHTVPASFHALQDMKQVEQMIQRLQKKAQDAPNDPRRQASMTKELRQGRALGKHLGQEVVHMMVENLTQDERLLPPVRRQLTELEPLLMQIAQGDPRFFGDKQHPARKFLERVTSRSLGFAHENDDGFAEFLTSTQNAVTALIAKPEDPVSRFTLVLQRLEAIWTEMDRLIKAKRDDAAKALLHAEQRNMLAQKLADQFRLQLGEMELPQSVSVFIFGLWPQVVAEAQLRVSDGRHDPQVYEAIVGELAWSVQPKVARRNLSRLVELIPNMLSRLREGLGLIEYPMDRVAEFFDELIAIHEAALETAARLQAARQAALAARDDEGATMLPVARDAQVAQDDADAADGRPSAFADPIPGMDDYWLGAEEAKDAGYVDEPSIMPVDVGADPSEPPAAEPQQVSVKDISLNSWVEIMIEGAWVRAQLSWVSPHRTLFMFVSPAGTAHSMTRRTMDRLRNEGLIRVISDGELVQQALDAVAQQALKNTLRKDPQA
jgi:Protein of unknown function (DUF1631)